MFNQCLFEIDDNLQNDKLKILYSMNDTLQLMTHQLDNICNHVEENTPLRSSSIDNLLLLSNDFESINKNISIDDNNNDEDESIFVLNDFNDPYSVLNQNIQDSPFSSASQLTISNQHYDINNNSCIKLVDIKNEKKVLQQHQKQQLQESNEKQKKKVGKRNKQQRLFNTFVRDSINTLLGPEYMRTHDVQDIDHNIMERIKSEAINKYLPDNTKPRRAWHLAKASLRTLKRTLNKKHSSIT